MSDAARTRVLLVRGAEARSQVSMRRFGAELERALRDEGEVRLEPSIALTPLPARGLEPAFTRYVRAPLAVARASGADTAAVMHITDHSHGHLAALAPAGRTVITCHDLMLLRARAGDAGFRGRPWSRARFAWSTSYLRRVARVICATEATKADVVRLRDVPPERIAVVPYGVSDRFRPVDETVRRRVRRELRVEGPVVLHVNSGQPYKNVPGTLRVVAGLRATGARVTLVRAGGPLRARERTLCRRLGLADAVRDLGPVPDTRLVELYGAADVLLFPSHAEGFGWPALEAMACGTPVVTSADRALREVVGDAGLWADAADVAGLARAVRAILDDPALAARLRAGGRERAAAHTWSRAARGYAAVYAEVARA